MGMPSDLLQRVRARREPAPRAPHDSLERKLRREFIVIAMAAVSVVLALIILGINVVNYVHVCNTADTRLGFVVANAEAIKDGQESSASESGADGAVDEGQQPSKMAKRRFEGMTPESPFDTRFFTVTLVDGKVADIDITNIAAVDAERAERFATKLCNKGRTSGFYGNYRFSASRDGETLTYTFVDCTRELSSFHSFLSASIGISLIGLLAVLLLVWAFSSAAIKPMVESYAKQKRFITDASHEIKTPLAVIDAANEVQEIEGGESEWTQSIHEQVARLTALTERLVFLAHMDEGAAGFAMSTVDLSPVVREAAEPFESVAAARSKSLELNIAEGVKVRADAAAIAQVVELLLDNATRYASEGTTIELALRAHGRNQAVLVAENDVDELPAGDLDRLFDRFYRADVSRNSKTGGSGVGLSVVRAIAEAHGGTATVTGRNNHITFAIRI